MKVVNVIVGLAVAGTVGFLGWRAYAQHKKTKGTGGYAASNLYTLPTELTPLAIKDVSPYAVEAVRVVYKDFVLNEAYVGENGVLYLVETHEGFDPLVFQVTAAKE